VGHFVTVKGVGVRLLTMTRHDLASDSTRGLRKSGAKLPAQVGRNAPLVGVLWRVARQAAAWRGVWGLGAW